MTFRRLLIANRGEIAARVIRTCQRLGIEAMLTVSEADRDALPARLADGVVLIGHGPSPASYLDVDAVVAAAQRVGADAVHPGYGFLSENARLARACGDAGIAFIGPSADVLEAVGDKLSARTHAVNAGLPVVPGGDADTGERALEVARRIGFPLLVKAVGGGGGRGMKRVDAEAELHSTLDLAMAEAEAAFGDARVYLERYVTSGRHVEVQVIGDGENVVHLGDRDCSVQRRFQKLFEEAPAPSLTDEVRLAMHDAAVALARSLRYRGLGTVEFLFDTDRVEFYFLEMNARIQVEHPVTEMITGLDLVAEQIAVAEGRSLRLTQNDIAFRGHALECRINAEEWRRDFRPSPGTVEAAVFPVSDGVRVDTHVQAGSVIPPYYDSLIAKVVVHASSRRDAVHRMRGALGGCSIQGVSTTLDVHQMLLEDDELAAGGVDTLFFERFLESHGEVEMTAGGADG
ncbi:MAG TPA: biotin carboxylase N-terminal domain-containing protein [Nocardioidaceae bacterium]|nr:biotin carboxylase N-terminal domain-containing protein [Nocardioidaceae bacterium]